MSVQDGVTDDYFDAVVVADGVAIRMSDNVAAIFANLMDQLLRLLEDGVAPHRRRPAEKVLKDMFPDAYRDRASSAEFRRRHAATLHDTAAVHRVRDRLVSATNHVIPQAEVDDWLVALGLGRFLHLRRDTRTLDDLGNWINHVQASLVAAVNPRLRPH